MRVKIEIDTGLEEPEVVIRCAELDDTIVHLQNLITKQGGGKRCMSLYKGETAYYVPVSQIYFFETEGKEIHAHTAEDIFETPFKLYELEEQLPAVLYCMFPPTGGWSLMYPIPLPVWKKKDIVIRMVTVPYISGEKCPLVLLKFVISNIESRAGRCD